MSQYGDVTTQIVREDPEIEAIKLGLLQMHKNLQVSLLAYLFWTKLTNPKPTLKANP